MEQMVLNFTVKNQVISYTKNFGKVVANSIGLLYFSIDFDDEWADLSKIVYFEGVAETYYVKIDDNKELYAIPTEVLTTPGFSVYVVGNCVETNTNNQPIIKKRIPSTKTYVNVENSGKFLGQPPKIEFDPDGIEALKIANISLSNSETAISCANQANTTSDSAYEKANNAFTAASNAVETATSAKNIADEATIVANAAITTASRATNTANNAKADATDANIFAQNANTTSSSAFAYADDALKKAKEAKEVADDAYEIVTKIESGLDEISKILGKPVEVDE